MAEFDDAFNEFNDINYFNDFLEKLKNGDEKAWNEFNEKFGKYISGKLKSDGYAKDDIMQEVLFKVFKYLPNCRATNGLPSFLSWLNRIISTSRADYYKNKVKEINKTTYSDIEKLNTKKDEREYNKHEKLQNALEECFKNVFHDKINESDLISKQIMYFLLEGKNPKEIRNAFGLTEGKFEYQRNLLFRRIITKCPNLQEFIPEN